MEDKIKILEAKLKLNTDINDCQNTLLWNLQDIATKVINILNSAYDKESTEELNIYKFNKDQERILEDLIYTAKSKDLISERSPEYLKIKVNEMKLKTEFLNMI